MQTPAPWDQVLAFGEYQHVTVNGDEVMTVFDASRCRVMLEDFTTRKNDIFVDCKHEVVDATGGEGDELLSQVDDWGKLDGRALAWADALAMVVAGQVVRYSRHATAPESPPNIFELQRPDGADAEDGVYARRYVVTPLGADPIMGLPSFRSTSPYFVPLRDGWRLLNYTATNDPRMEGVSLGAVEMARQRDGSWSMQTSGLVRVGRQAMQRREAHVRARITMENRMDPEKMKRLMEAAGCKAEDKPEEVAGKMSAYASKMEDDAAEMKRQMEAGTAAKLEADEKDKKKKEDDEREAAARKAEADQPAKEAMQAMQRDNKALTAKVGVLEGQLEKVTKLLPALEAQAMESKEVKAEKWASSAIAMGRYPHDAEGDQDKTVAKLKGEYLADPVVAEKILFVPNKFPRPAEVQAMARLTSRGAGHGTPKPDEGDNTPAAKYGQAMTRAYKKLDDTKQVRSSDAADAIVKRDEPDVHAAQWGAR